MIYKALNVHAHEYLRIQVHIPEIYQSPLHSSKIVEVFERTNVQLHDHLSLQAYKHISIQECAHVYGYHTSEYQCL